MTTDISVTFAAAADLLERRDRCHPRHRRRDQQRQMRRTVGRSHTSRRRIGKRLLDDSISTLGADVVAGFETYHVMNPYDDGISMDTYVDWLIEAGHPIARVPDYATWLARFETTLRALPEKQRQASLLPLLHNYQQPQHPINGSLAPADRFRTAVQEAKIGPDKDIPHISAPEIVKYITDLELLGLL